MKYIDAEKLKKFVESIGLTPQKSADYNDGRDDVKRMVLDFIDPLQQDEKAVELEMCSQAYWEEQGWIMIPPDVTIEGIDSLLKQVRKKLRQEQPNLPGYDMALLEVKSKVDELYEESSIGLNEYDLGLYNGIVETCMKLRGFIKARISSEEHPEGGYSEKPNDLLSEPEVDLEKEIDRFWDSCIKHKNERGGNVIWSNKIEIEVLARHFYDLGRNTNKQ